MNTRETNRATFAEVFGSIKFNNKNAKQAPAVQWPEPGFAVGKSTHVGEAALDDYKQLVRSSN